MKKKSKAKSANSKKIRTKTEASAKKRGQQNPKLWTCYYCLSKVDAKKGHDCVPLSERDLVTNMNEDLRDAFQKLKQTATRLGTQKVYNNARAIMFARRVCYMFVRPKKSFLELNFFLPRKQADKAINRVDQVSKAKFAHKYRLVHADQIEEPLTDWIKEAFEQSS